MVKIDNLTCGYGSETVLENFSAKFEKGKISAITGRSGIGKSTLLKSINRLHEVEDNSFFKVGNIVADIDNKEVDVYTQDPYYIRRKIGYIFQTPTPLPLSIIKNVSFGLDIQAISDKCRVESALKAAYLWQEVKDRLDSDPNSLSIGQQQRLAIARALVLEPEILLLDEPTSALDAYATDKIEQMISELKRDKTIIIVTHDKKQIERISDKVFYLDDLPITNN